MNTTWRLTPDVRPQIVHMLSLPSLHIPTVHVGARGMWAMRHVFEHAWYLCACSAAEEWVASSIALFPSTCQRGSMSVSDQATPTYV